MSNTENKNIDEKIEKLEAVVDPNTVVSVGGYSFTPAKLMIAATILSTLGGASWGAFQFWNDYMSMKEAIQNYTAPDFSDYEKRIIVLEQNLEKGVEYTREINTNLKGDIRRIEQVVDGVERSSKTAQREVEKDVNDIRRQVDGEIKEVRRGVDSAVREMQKQVDSTVQNVNERVNRIERETSAEIRTIRKEVDDKIKKALDNPLAN
jgi:BMFP domain-containing protein YqiC